MNTKQAKYEHEFKELSKELTIEELETLWTTQRIKKGVLKSFNDIFEKYILTDFDDLNKTMYENGKYSFNLKLNILLRKYESLKNETDN